MKFDHESFVFFRGGWGREGEGGRGNGETQWGDNFMHIVWQADCELEMQLLN